MHAVGVLEPKETPNEDATFVDIKIAWIIEGLAHSHEDLSRPEAAPSVLKREGTTVVANASVKEYNEISPENINSFHFHDDSATLLITAVNVVPNDVRDSVLMQEPP